MDELPWGWTVDGAMRMAWTAARRHPMTIQSTAARADAALYAIIVLLYESESDPGSDAIWYAAFNAIGDAARDELHHHGYSTTTMHRSGRYYAYWGTVHTPRDGLEESVLEPLALRQVMDALPANDRLVLEALAEHGSYSAAARALGITYNAISCRLHAARFQARWMWNYPDPPGRFWGKDRHGTGDKNRAIRGIRWRKRHRKKLAAEASPE